MQLKDTLWEVLELEFLQAVNGVLMCRRFGVRVRCTRFVRMEMAREGVRGSMMVDVSISGLPMVRGRESFYRWESGYFCREDWEGWFGCLCTSCQCKTQCLLSTCLVG
jgi:hypothetical protein